MNEHHEGGDMRRILGRALVGSAIALAMTAPIMSQNTFAQSTSVDAWATIGTIHPAAGCTVDVAIEVRDGGAALSGANVAIEVSLDDSGEVISTDSAATNDSGVAYLTYDTSAAGADAKGWLSLSINGGYVGGQSIWTDGDSCSGSQAVVDFSGDVPSVSVAESPSSSSSESSSSAVIIPNVSAYQQQRPLSCEYASLASRPVRSATGSPSTTSTTWSVGRRIRTGATVATSMAPGATPPTTASMPKRWCRR